MNEFEKQLSRQPWKSVPPEWRSEILQAANARGRQNSPPVTASAWLWLRAWLWPQPRAWAALAALWIIIVGFHLATPGAPSASRRMNASLNVASVSEQRRELAELLGTTGEADERSPADRPRSARTVPQRFQPA